MIVFSPGITRPKVARPIFPDSEEDEEDEIEEKSSTCFDTEIFLDLESILTKDWTSHQTSKGIMPWIIDMHRRQKMATQ